MATPEYPDRDRWPEYWHTVRRAAVTFVVGILLLAPLAIISDSLAGLPAAWRFIAIVVAAIVAFSLGGILADRIIAAWERRLGNDGPA